VNKVSIGVNNLIVWFYHLT